MISILQSLYRYFWRDPDPPPPPSVSDLASVLFDKDDGSHTETCKLCGTVTSWKEGEGFIDNDMYFDFSKLPMGEVPKVGSTVLYSAFRESPEAPWQLQEIKEINVDVWDSDEKPIVYEVGKDAFEGQKKTIVGTVTRVSEDGVISLDEQGISFHLKTGQLDFSPIRGDWLSVETIIKPQDVAHVEDHISPLNIATVQPLRSKSLTCKVTNLTQNSGVADGNVYFTKSSCVNGYFPRRGDSVRVFAIESMQGRFSWRATRIVPLTPKLFPEKNFQPSPNTPSLSFIEELLKDKCEIVISENIDFGKVGLGEVKEHSFYIRNLGTETRTLKKLKVQSKEENSQISFVVQPDNSTSRDFLPEQDILLPSGRVEPVILHCEGKLIGRTQELIVLTFDGFSVGRQVKLEVVDSKQHLLNPHSHRHDRRPQKLLSLMSKSNSSTVPGQRPYRPPAFLPTRLRQYEVPRWMWEEMSTNKNADMVSRVPVLAETLTSKNYVEKFSTLLHMEEVVATFGMRQFDIDLAGLRHAGEFLGLTVPGLAEGRPTLLIGDRVILAHPWEESAPKFEGFIHDVRQSEVMLKFHPDFHLKYDGEDYQVSFWFNRTPLRRYHLSVELAIKQLSPSILFPESVVAKQPQIHFRDDMKKILGNVTRLPGMKNLPKISNGAAYVNRVTKLKPASELQDSTTLDTKDANSSDDSNTCCENPDPNSAFIKKTPARKKMLVADRLFGNKTPSPEPKLVKSPSPELKPVNTTSAKPKLAESPSLEPKLAESPSLEPKLGKTPSAEPKLVKAPSLKSKPVKKVSVGTSVNMIKHSSKHSAMGSQDSGESKPISSMKLNGFICPKRLTLEPTKQLPNKSPNPHLVSNNNSQKLSWINEQLNERQQSAVKRILEGCARPLLYVIYGPPGTGKTVTLVEAVLQVFLLMPESRILVASPSNSSADLIVEHLHRSHRVSPGDVVRLNAFQRSADSIPGHIQPYCSWGSKLDVVVRSRILVCTCTTSGTLYTLGLKPGHFSHVFVDEAGHTTEPECLVPMGLAAGSKTQLVLAGDPKQLGPVLQSSHAKFYGLQTSLLERLCENPLYRRNELKFVDHGCYDPLLITKLVNNYRSHPALITVPSKLFYDNELVPCANEEVTERLCHLDFLPRKDFPLLFHGIRGDNYQEGDSPSWFNPSEALQIAKYLQVIYSAGVKSSDIGIITPYRKQVEKIRQVLGLFGLNSCDGAANKNSVECSGTENEAEAAVCSKRNSVLKVGSVEEFQGQERGVILVSTVRCTQEQVTEDVAHNLGFLSNPKRFNVAVTRAKSLLIVIGDPHLLFTDTYWSEFLMHCVKNGSYRGCNLPLELQLIANNCDLS